jgi:hypothetical protein
MDLTTLKLDPSTINVHTEIIHYYPYVWQVNARTILGYFICGLMSDLL